MERSVGSVDALIEQAQPPHFLQMHTGDYDVAALDEFAEQHPEIDSWLIEDMVGFDGAAISWQRPGSDDAGDFSKSLIDNLFVARRTHRRLTHIGHLDQGRGKQPGGRTLGVAARARLLRPPALLSAH